MPDLTDPVAYDTHDRGRPRVASLVATRRGGGPFLAWDDLGRGGGGGWLGVWHLNRHLGCLGRGARWRRPVAPREEGGVPGLLGIGRLYAGRWALGVLRALRALRTS